MRGQTPLWWEEWQDDSEWEDLESHGRGLLSPISCLTLGDEVCHLCLGVSIIEYFFKYDFLEVLMCAGLRRAATEIHVVVHGHRKGLLLASFSKRSSATYTCHRWSSQAPWHQAFLTRPTEIPGALQGKKGTRTLAKAERTQRWSCCNYFNLNLAMARAVDDTALS